MSFFSEKHGKRKFLPLCICMPIEEEYYRQALKRKLERMQLSPSEVEKALQESDDFVDGLDEVFDEMFPPTNCKPVDDSDADQFQLGAIL